MSDFFNFSVLHSRNTHIFLLMDNDIFLQRVNTIRPDLEKVIRNKVRVKADAEDILQDVWMRLWEVREKWSQYDDYKPLALKILEHCIVNYYRKNVEMEPIENHLMLEYLETPDKIIENKELRRHILKLMEQLPPTQQLVMRLKGIEGYEIVETAKIINATPDTVQRNFTRARKKMKDELIRDEMMW